MRAAPVLRAFRDINTACHHADINSSTVSSLIGQFALTGSITENPEPRPLHESGFEPSGS